MSVEICSLPKRFPGWWRPLLREWGRLLDEYRNLFRNDAAHWWGERALTGFLVSAAWRLSKGWGLLEFTGARRRGRERRTGQGDAWVGRGNRSWSAIECKVVYVYTTDTKKTVRRIREALRQAKEDLRRLDKNYRGKNPVAISHVVPDLRENRSWSRPEGVKALFDGLAEHFRSARTMIAIYRPVGPAVPAEEGRCWPGVILIGKMVL